MIDFKEQARKQSKRRGIVLLVLFLAVFVGFAARMVQIQVIKHDYYVEQAKISDRRVVTISATRGTVLDRNGTPLVTNRASNCIIIDAAYFPSEKEQKSRNEIVIGLIRLLESRGEEWINDLPLVFDSEGEVQYRTEKDDEKHITFLKSKDMLHLNEYATAQNCFDNLIEKYELQAYSKQDALKISAVYFGQRYDDFSISRAYTFARDVSSETVAMVQEQSAFYKGVNTTVESIREYPDDSVAPHVLGAVGKLNDKQYETLKDKGYALDDIVGQFGIEQVAEEYLRGTNGKKNVVTSANGNVTENVIVEPENGNNVVLTIDKNLQLAAQKVLKEQIDKLSASGYSKSAGAVVGIDVHTGEVLLSASYPTYTMTQYQKNIKDLNDTKKNPKSPLTNRALEGLYSPGSSIKPAVALGGLESGTITPTSTYNCTRQYFRFNQFYCLEFNGNINVVDALKHSCNIFFYETGFNMGIDTMNYYTSLLGLGEKTGSELPEASGQLVTPEQYELTHSEPWQAGNTVQAAIGQSDTLVTPIQLANYCATIANNGTRYTPHFIKTVKNYDYSQTILNKQPEVLMKDKFSQANLQTVQKGMSLVPQYTGSATYSILSRYSPQVACKTGTAQKWNENGKVDQLNVFLIAYAPYDNPQIALGIAVEDARNSSVTATIAARILDAYFGSSGVVQAGQQPGTLLS